MTIGSLLSLALDVVPPIMRYIGMREESVTKFIETVKRLQKDAPNSTIAADEEAAALDKLQKRNGP
jgi:hypothetical protein